MSSAASRPYTLWRFVGENGIKVTKKKWKNGYGWDFLFEKDGKEALVDYWDITYYPLKVCLILKNSLGLS